jgi:hypothetical protein
MSSMMTFSGQGGHSARVNMQLLVNGFSLAISQMGPDFIFLEAPVNHPPGDASVVFRVDQSERSWKVHLPDGILATSQRVAIAVCE